MPTPAEVANQLRRSFQHEQHRLGAQGTKLTLDLLTAFLRGKVGEKEYAAAAPLIEIDYHRRSAGQAAEHLRLLRELLAPRQRHTDPVLDVIDPRQAIARTASTIRFRRSFEDRDDLGPLPHASRTAKLYMQRVALETNKTVLSAGRRTIHNSAIANHTRWRRITSPGACAFCAYQAALTANYPDLNSGMVNYFHANCGCTVTEAFTSDLSPAEQAQTDLYQRAYQACRDDGLSLTPTHIASKMRELGDGIVQDAAQPKTQTGGAGGGGRGGGGKPPRKPSSGTPEPRKPKRGGREPRERTAEDYDYWQARQDALPFETTGAVMKPHEIEFAEAFIADGHEILRWIPQGVPDEHGRIHSASDFEWTSGRETELKRTNNLQTMKDYTRANLKKGKRIFMVDFGQRPPRGSVLNGLRKFSPEAGPIEELWAYWNGTLVRLQ